MVVVVGGLVVLVVGGAAVVPGTVTEEVQAPMAIPIETRRIGTAREATRRARIGPGP